MHTEAVHLPAGTRLVLTIFYNPKTTEFAPYKYGVGEGFNSVLRIPFLDPEEAFYRMPEIFPQARILPLEQAGGGLLGLLGIAASVVPTFVSRGRRRPMLLLAFALAILPMASCLTNAREAGLQKTANPQVTPASVDVTYRDPGDSGLADPGNGSIVGRISDPYARPVADASVYVLGTHHFVKTERFGLFGIKPLRPGTYTLRVDKSDFQSAEVAVRVEANKVAAIEIQLAYDVSLALGNRPHPHDYWNGENKTVLYDGPIPKGNFYVPWEEGGSKNLIRPGTADVEVNLTFDMERVTKRMGLVFRANHDPSTQNWSVLAPRPSGVPFHIRSTWEMTDVGHQRFSTWEFVPYISAHDAIPGAQCCGAEWTVNQVLPPPPPKVSRMILTIHRGALPLEPPHPDPWGTKTEITVMSEAPLKADFGRFDPVGFTFGLGAAFYLNCQKTAATGLSLPRPQVPIPVGTGDLVVVTKLNRPTGAQGVYEYGWELWYKTGESPLSYYSPEAPLWKKIPEGDLSADRLTWSWHLPITDKDADGIYNKRSAWGFQLVPDNPEAACNDEAMHEGLGVGGNPVFKGPIETKTTITAQRATPDTS